MESDDCRLARLITEATIKNLQNRKGMWPDDLGDEQNEAIRHSLYSKALGIIRAEAAQTGGKAQP